MDDFSMDFDYFWGLIKSKTNFAFARYADGEVLLMNGQAVTQETQAYRVDKWQAPNELTKVGCDLLETLNHEEIDYYYAISAVSDNINDYNFLKERIKQKPETLTFVNLWINANYQKTKEKLSTLDREVVLICNVAARAQNFPFPVKVIDGFPDDCIKFWEEHGDRYIKYLIDIYGEMQNQLFFISCGPVSEIIIHKLYQHNPNNTYIDMGSSLDEFIHGRKTRPYMDPNSRYANEKSSFE